MGAAIFKMSNSTSTASTLNTPLTVTGLVTGTNLSATTFTASRVASIDGSKNLVSTDQALLKLAASNTDYSLIGSTSPDGTTNTRIVLSANSRSGNPGEITYITTGASGAHVWWTGGATEKMRLSNAGDLTVVGTITAPPNYGRRYKPTNQTIPFSTNTDITFNDAVYPASLSSNGISYTNTTARELAIQVNYSLLIDGYFGSAYVYAWIELSNGKIYGYTFEVVDSSSGAITNSSIIQLAVGLSFKLVITLNQTIDVKGGADGNSAVSEMSCYILN